MRLKLFVVAVVVLMIGVGAWFAAHHANGAKQTAAPLISFHYSHRGSSSDSFYSYEVTESGNGYCFRFLSLREEDVQATAMSTEDADALVAIINRHDLWKWHGFSKTDSNIMDGTSFSLRVSFADGTVIEANGSNRFPSTYSAACAEMDTLFAKYIKEPEK